jgi:hypothetical protein
MADLLERERALLHRLDADARDQLAAALRTLVGPFESGSPTVRPDRPSRPGQAAQAGQSALSLPDEPAVP